MALTSRCCTCCNCNCKCPAAITRSACKHGSRASRAQQNRMAKLEVEHKFAASNMEIRSPRVCDSCGAEALIREQLAWRADFTSQRAQKQTTTTTGNEEAKEVGRHAHSISHTKHPASSRPLAASLAASRERHLGEAN